MVDDIAFLVLRGDWRVHTTCMFGEPDEKNLDDLDCWVFKVKALL